MSTFCENKFVDESRFFRSIERRKRDRTKTGSKSPIALLITVEMSKEDADPLFNSKSIIPSHVCGESIFSRSMSSADNSDGGDWRSMSSLSSRLPLKPAFSAMCLHREETKASPPWIGDLIRILSLNCRRKIL